jgi:hypothetical protein
MGVRQWRLGAGYEQLHHGFAGFRMDMREWRLAASGHGDDLQHAYYDVLGRVHDAGSVHRDRRRHLRERRLAPAELAETIFSVAAFRFGRMAANRRSSSRLPTDALIRGAL